MRAGVLVGGSRLKPSLLHKCSIKMFTLQQRLMVPGEGLTQCEQYQHKHFLKTMPDKHPHDLQLHHLHFIKVAGAAAMPWGPVSFCCMVSLFVHQ